MVWEIPFMTRKVTSTKSVEAPLLKCRMWGGKVMGTKRRIAFTKIATAIRDDRDVQQGGRMTNLRAAIAMGIQSADSGDLHDWDDAVQIEIKALGRARRS
jgi:hypothetical protein